MAEEQDKTQRRKALGRGLNAILPARSSSGEPSVVGYRVVPVALIEPAAGQPRRRIDDENITELAASIKSSGLIQPLVVRKKGNGFEIIAGERRWRASVQAGLEEVPVVVRELDDRDAFAMALVENIQREDLNAIEEALAYERLVEEFGYTQQALADEVGKSRPAIANALRLLQLPADVRGMVMDGQLSAGHARALAGLGHEEARELAQIIVKHGYSVRETEELVRESAARPAAQEKRPARFRDDAQVLDVTDKIQKALGTKVRLKDKDGKGRIEIFYDNYEVLQGILERMLIELD